MKNPFESIRVNYSILICCLGIGEYLAAREKDISIGGILLLGLIVGLCIFLFIKFAVSLIFEIKRRKDNGIDMTVMLESDPEVVKSHMLHIMQFGHPEGIKEALNEFNDIFRNYPQWELEKWEVFRAWYKDLIDYALAHPDIYDMKQKEDGSIYVKEEDALYDSEAPDWEQFAAEIIDEESEGYKNTPDYVRPLTFAERMRLPFGTRF